MISNLLLATGLALASGSNVATLVKNEPSVIKMMANPTTEFWAFSLRKPNNVNDFWYDVCTVNGLRTSWFHDSDKWEDLDRLRSYYAIDDNSLPIRMGELYKTGYPKKTEVFDENIGDEKFTNNSDDLVMWNTKSREKSLKQTTSWTIDLSISESIKIKYLFGSTSIKITAGTSHSETTEEVTTDRYNGQTLPVKAHSTGHLETKTWSENMQSTGGVQYKLNWNDRQYINFRYNNNKKSIRVNIGWTLWAIANNDTNRTNFKRDSRDLFIYEDRTFYLNFPATWKTSVQKVQYTYNNY